MKVELFREKMIEAGLSAQTDKIGFHHYENAYAKYLHRFKEKKEFFHVGNWVWIRSRN